MFVHVDTRRRSGFCWATMLIVVVCVVSFVALALAGRTERMAIMLHWERSPHTCSEPVFRSCSK